MVNSITYFRIIIVLPIVAVLLCLSHVSAADDSVSIDYAKILMDCKQFLQERTEERRQHPEVAFSRYLQYYDAYYESLGTKYKEQTDLDAIIDKARQSRVVLLGDLHDIAECRRNQMRILDKLSSTNQITLGVEFIPVQLSENLARFMNGDMEIREFSGKAKVFWNYFDNESLLYADLLEFAKRKKMRVVPLESADLDMERLLVNGETPRRDEHASKIVNSLKERLGKQEILCVIYGFYHCLGQGHLAEMLTEDPLTILPWAPLQHAKFQLENLGIASFALSIEDHIYYLPCTYGQGFGDLVDVIQLKNQLQEHSSRTELVRLRDKYGSRSQNKE